MPNHHNFILGLQIDWSKILPSYIWDIPALQKSGELSFQRPITFFVGENGCGKSTLLEGIAAKMGFHPEGGTQNFAFETNEMCSPLYQGLEVYKSWRKMKTGFFLRAESFYNVETQIDAYKVKHCYGGKSLHHCSHGESFFALMQNRFSEKGLYLLDEPEAALSPQRQLSCLSILRHLSKEGCQFIIATHSPILLGLPGADILQFDEGGIRRVSYEETDSYFIMKQFLNQRERMLKELLVESE